MSAAGWIAAAILAGLVLVAGLFRGRIAGFFGYEPVREPEKSLDRGAAGQMATVVAPENGNDQARNRLDELFELGELEVSDVMVHRTNMRSVNAVGSPAENQIVTRRTPGGLLCHVDFGKAVLFEEALFLGDDERRCIRQGDEAELDADYLRRGGSGESA